MIATLWTAIRRFFCPPLDHVRPHVEVLCSCCGIFTTAYAVNPRTRLVRCLACYREITERV